MSESGGHGSLIGMIVIKAQRRQGRCAETHAGLWLCGW